MKKTNSKTNKPETKEQGLLASTKRVFARLASSLAKIAGQQDTLAAHVEKSKEAIAALLEEATDDRKAIWSECSPEERKAVGKRLYDELVKTHKLKPQRASDVLKQVGIKIGNKSTVEALDVDKEHVEQLFLLADKLEKKDPRKVCALLSRAYGKGRKVYPAKK
jgi:acyl-CoA reductase-like NAD-dependent aldehyde dehydrogenase